jgi:hypothetical protein
MQMSYTENQTAQPRARRTRYRIANHGEAGVFETMTDATLWALRNLEDWEWRIEAVAGTAVILKMSGPDSCQ